MAIEVLRLKKGTVYRAVFYQNKNRESQCFDRKYDAQKWLEERETRHRYGYQGKISFSQACQIWLENHSKIRKAPSCYEMDRRLIESRFIVSFGDVDLEKITPEGVEAYISRMLAEGLKPPTVNRHLQTLRAILNYYVKKRRLLFNPVSLVGLLPESDAHFDYLSLDEASQFLEFASGKYRTRNRWVYRFYLLALQTGLRWGEVVGLKWDRVDFRNKQIIVSRSYCRISKQVRETTKGRKIRHVGITSSLNPELRIQYEETGSSQGLVFARILDIKNFKRDHFEKDLGEAGIRRIRIHDLRHTFASHFMMNGGNLYDLQKLLGHSDIETTERYAHLSPAHVVSKTELVAIRGGRENVVPMKVSDVV